MTERKSEEQKTEDWARSGMTAPLPDTWVCAECGSKNVEATFWVNVNTNVVNDGFGSWNAGDNTYCPDCSHQGRSPHPDLIMLEEYEDRRAIPADDVWVAVHGIELMRISSRKAGREATMRKGLNGTFVIEENGKEVGRGTDGYLEATGTLHKYVERNWKMAPELAREPSIEEAGG